MAPHCAPPPAETPKQEKRRLAAEFKSMPCMTHVEAAKRLRVAPRKVLGWLESGALKGRQFSRTKWKISGQDLLAFVRENPDLT